MSQQTIAPPSSTKLFRISYNVITNFRKEAEKSASCFLHESGYEVVLQTGDRDFRALLEQGTLSYGDNHRLIKGQPSSCHSNSAKLYDENPDRLRIATGYALSEDGCWRQHSWLVDKDNDEQIIETTVPRVAYYGIVLDKEQCEMFVDDNLF